MELILEVAVEPLVVEEALAALALALATQPDALHMFLIHLMAEPVFNHY